MAAQPVMPGSAGPAASRLQPVRLFAAEWPAARARWRETDPRLHQVTPEQPVERLMEAMPTSFGALVRAVVHQQLSIFAGRAIMGRLADACGGRVEPERVLALTDPQLLGIGLSRRKAACVQALSRAALHGHLEGLETLAEEDLRQRLAVLPGVGRWTVEMFALFHLQRPDVFSGRDLGLRQGIRILDGRKQPPTPAEAERRAEVWRPYRSVAAVVLWDLVRRERRRQP